MTAANPAVRTTVSLWCLISAVAAFGLVAGAGAWIPADWLHQSADRLGHADDVSPERISRLRLVGGGLAMAHFLLAGFLATLGRVATDQVLSELDREISEARPIAGIRRLCDWSLEHGWLHLATLLVVLGVAVAVRLAYLRVPMDYDEAYSFLNYARRPIYQGLADYNSTNNHLLNTLLMHVTHLSFGPQEWALRLPVFAAGVALVGSTYVMGRSLHSPQAGLVAAALMATSDVMINYSVNARGYIWQAWMTLLLMWAFWRIASAGPDWLVVDWIGAWMAAVLGIFALPTMVYSVAGCVAWFGIALSRLRGQARTQLAGLQVWVLFVLLGSIWLYAPGLVFRGISAWQHPFVSAQPFGQWLQRVPATWILAIQCWSEGPVPWFVLCVLFAIGLVALAVSHRHAFGLLLSILLASFLIMAIQRVSPPPRVLSFLAPVFAVGAAVGLVVVLRLISKEYESSMAGCRPSRLTSIVMCSIIAVGLCVAAGMQNRKQKLPGGAHATYLIEDVGQFWAKDQPSSLPGGRNQFWRLDVEAAVNLIEMEVAAGDRVLVGLPADLPFHFYAARRGWTTPIGGQPLPTERLFLVIRTGENPRTAIQSNPSLQLRDPWLLKANWQFLTAGDLAIWQALPVSAAPTKSTSP